MPDELARDFMYIELRVPIFRAAGVPATRGRPDRRRRRTVECDDGTLHQLAQALQGLTFDEAGHAIRRAVAGRNA